MLGRVLVVVAALAAVCVAVAACVVGAVFVDSADAGDRAVGVVVVVAGFAWAAIVAVGARLLRAGRHRAAVAVLAAHVVVDVAAVVVAAVALEAAVRP